MKTKKQSNANRRINDRALSADDSPDFSKLIRQGIPGMGYMPEKGD
ncbi:MAG: hypothetical protein K9K82_05295 [Desulfobacteraceae bacterium]|nr:hypothetical protein [Desulfobacteraceae bacterium]